jgi:hypothetical protein
MPRWAEGPRLEGRAAVAALCEPALLTGPERVAAALAVVERATDAVAAADPDARRSDAFAALRKALSYGWSVVVAAAPEPGRPAFERLVARAAAGADRDLRRIARDNLGRRRLVRLDPAWAARLAGTH